MKEVVFYVYFSKSKMRIEQLRMKSSMLSTQEFIKRKCSKDHFKPSIQNLTKHTSVYSIDYKSNQKLKKLDLNARTGKERNTPTKDPHTYLFPPTSVYRKSYESTQVPVPIKYHEKPSYFLKTENYEPPQSTYNRSSIIRTEDWNDSSLKGKPLMDNLTVAKYNKMSTKSLYRDSYLNFIKLPSLHKEKEQKTITEPTLRRDIIR